MVSFFWQACVYAPLHILAISSAADEDFELFAGIRLDSPPSVPSIQRVFQIAHQLLLAPHLKFTV